MPRQRYTAYIYSQDEVRRIMDAALHLRPKGSLLPCAFHTLFGLLATTGMRISEALALRFDDVTHDGLVIQRTKFRKSRILPLHETTAEALARYLKRRQLVGGSDEHLFISPAGSPLPYDSTRLTFRKILRQLDFHSQSGKPTPRLHDFRHTFAVRALENCPPGCRDRISRHMLALSTYLGHSCITRTYWYLQLTPHLERDIADACEVFIDKEKP